MSTVTAGQSPTDRYQARIMAAALTKCRDHDEAAKLMAQYFALAPHMQQVIDQAGELSESKQYLQAIALLDEMIGRAERFTSPYPLEAVRDVFGYDMARLYGMRAAIQFNSSAKSADPIAVLNAVLADLDRAQRYPRSCFGELNPEYPDTTSEFRTIVEACIKGQKAFEAKESSSTSAAKSTGCLTLIALCGIIWLLGVMLF